MNSSPELDKLCINNIRTLSIDAVGKANSGHPGLPLGAAPMAYVLWQNHLRHNPKNPAWPNRDRFVLSAGHGSMLLYSLLHLSGYEVSGVDVANFRQWGSITPGHPEFGLTPGVEATTGPLGQGTANSVGMAIAERALAHLFNRPEFNLVDHHTYALVSDGDLMEGICAEAASLAGHLKLGKLIWLYDSNDISLDGPTQLTYTENTKLRFESLGWQVLSVSDGNEGLDQLNDAITQAKAETTRPTLIVVKTTIGFGSPIQGSSKVHGSPLSPQQIELTKAKLGWKDQTPLQVLPEVRAHMGRAVESGIALEQKWNSLFDQYQSKYPELAELWQKSLRGELSAEILNDIPTWKSGESVPTRTASGKVLNYLATKIPNLLGGDADLSCSTMTLLEGRGDFDGQTGKGRNIRFGVREHAMAGIANGIGYHGGLRVFVATFFCFLDYMKPSVRLAAMNHLPITYIWTHDSIGLGEDGPTHQPVEHLASLRSIPNFVEIRPCDATETAQAWSYAMTDMKRPVGLVLSRQKLPVIERTVVTNSKSDVWKGAYILKPEEGNLDVVLVATGSEVSLALEVARTLKRQSIESRVVSMPSWKLFSEQPLSYRESVLPKSARLKVAIEAASSLGWERWVGDGLIFALDRFGASAPAEILYENLGFSVANIASEIQKRLRT